MNLFWSTPFLWWYKTSYFVPGKTTLYKRPMRAIWKLWRKLAKNVFLTVRYANQGYLIVHETDIIQRSIILNGMYEIEVWNALSSQLTEDDVLWDIGANIGTVSIRASHDPRIKAVYAFEPQPRALELLENNIRLNTTGKICLHPIALSDKVGKLVLYLSGETNIGKTSFAEDMRGGNVEVMCTTVDEMLQDTALSAPTILKLDVEGWEEKVLMGAINLLRTYPPKAIVFEAECSENRSLTNQNLSALLLSNGYQITYIQRPSGQMHNSNNRNCYVENFIASRQ